MKPAEALEALRGTPGEKLEKAIPTIVWNRHLLEILANATWEKAQERSNEEWLKRIAEAKGLKRGAELLLDWVNDRGHAIVQLCIAKRGMGGEV